MKRKYCLVRNDGVPKVGSFVYVIWVGSSLRESALLALVEEFCKDCGWYFKQWSNTVDSALEKRAKLMRLDGNKSASPFTFHQLTIQQCYEAIIDDSWASIEAHHVMTPQEKYMRFRNVPAFLLSMHRKNRNTSCSPSKRKYLSPSRQGNVFDLVCGCTLVLVLLVLDAIVSNLFL